jgi:uncharacterized protein YerC
MPHISSKKLDKKILDQLFKKLVCTLDRASDRNLLFKALFELLTPTERIMLAKRLTMATLVSSEIPNHRIAEVLLVSPATSAKISLGVEKGKFDTLLKMSQKEKTDLEKIAWLLLTMGGLVPPQLGRKYWSKKRKTKYQKLLN